MGGHHKGETVQFVQLVISGIAQGCIYGLIALGFVLIYKATEVLNFAHGDLLVVSAFSAWGLIAVAGLPFWLALLLVVLGVVNIIYAALTSFAQRNLKRKIAYSSISHMGFVLIGIGSFSDLATSGAMLQMVSHGLIGASLFFLVGATYDRTHTLQLDEMGGVGQKMRKMFALWTVCSLASLALPGMSGFVSELMVFVGFATSEAYSLSFRVVICVLAAVGVILTPIYLLSMLREIFFGKENAELAAHTHLVDAEPREIYVISCLLVPIIGIGLYPRLITDTYRASIETLVGRETAGLERVNDPPAAAVMRRPVAALAGLPRLQAPPLLS
jgi:NAD(P)H-quinone oxidoreductase subunit 4